MRFQTLLVAAVAVLPLGLAAAWSQTNELEPVVVSVASVTDSADYLVYSYVVTNPAASTQAIGQFGWNVGVNAGIRFERLPSTGHVKFYPDMPSAFLAPLGVSPPDGWRATCCVDEQISFWSSNSTDVDADSIAPGVGLAGILLRSTFLPGVREAYAEPTLQSCCDVPFPDPDTGLPCDTTGGQSCFYPNSDLFEVRTLTVTPVYAPDEMDVGALNDLVAQVCGDLDWIGDTATCTQLEAHAGEALTHSAANDFAKVRQAFNAMLTLLHAGHTGGTVNDNAYWMLVTDARFIRDSLPLLACGAVTPTTLLAGGNQPAGIVNVSHSPDSVFVEYSMSPGWFLGEAHLAPAISKAGIPTNKAGNPMIGQFPHHSVHAPAIGSHSVRLALATVGAALGDELLIAAHAEVTGPSGSEGAWAEGQQFTEGGSWATYFTYDLAPCSP